MATKDHNVQIANADRRPVSGPFNFIRLHTTTGPLNIDIDGRVTQLVAGQAIELDKPVDEFVVENNSGAQVTATFKLGLLGRVTDNNLAGNVTLSKATGLSDTADSVVANTAVATIAANTSRRAVIVGSLAANTGNLRVGDNPGAARGQELKPGESITLETTKAVKVANNSGASQTITVVEVLD